MDFENNRKTAGSGKISKAESRMPINRGLMFPTFCSLISILSLPCHAQITVDWANGAALPLENHTYALDAGLGRHAGGNLFHSFGEFSVESGNTVVFGGDSGVERIIGRVTGHDISRIDGTIAYADGLAADLYLFNPNGVAFGKDAAVDINGADIDAANEGSHQCIIG